MIEHDQNSGCEGCPFRGIEFSRFCDEPADADNVCNATTERRHTDHGDSNGAPEWCPLRSGPVTVTGTASITVPVPAAHPKSTSRWTFERFREGLPTEDEMRARGATARQIDLARKMGMRQ